ncbi:MAG: hypothetical protein WCK49_02090 [Myxococcaceae bacterium]
MMNRFLLLFLFPVFLQAASMGIIIDLANIDQANRDLRLRVFDVARSMKKVFSIDESNIVLLHDLGSEDIQCVNNTHAMGRDYNYAILPVAPIDINPDLTKNASSVRFCTCDPVYERRSMVYAGLCAPLWSLVDLQQILTTQSAVKRWLVITSPGSLLSGMDLDFLQKFQEQDQVVYAMHIGEKSGSSFASTLARASGGEVYTLQENNDLDVAEKTFEALTSLAIWQEVTPKTTLQNSATHFQAFNQISVSSGDSIFLTQFVRSSNYVSSQILDHHAESFPFIAGQTLNYVATQDDFVQTAYDFNQGSITARTDKTAEFPSLRWFSSLAPFSETNPIRLRVQLQAPVNSLSVTGEINGSYKLVVDCINIGTRGLVWSCPLQGYTTPGAFTFSVTSTTSNQILTNTKVHGYMSKSSSEEVRFAPAAQCQSPTTRLNWCDCQRGFVMPNGGL